MKIDKIEQFAPLARVRLVKITTDTGLVGWGETTLEGKARSGMAAVDEMADVLVGRDPLRIEDHWQLLYRSAFYRGGAVVMSALSGIDQALWDIVGKYSTNRCINSSVAPSAIGCACMRIGGSAT